MPKATNPAVATITIADQTVTPDNTSNLMAAYLEADMKGKAAIRSGVDAALKSAVTLGDMALAQFAMALMGELKASKPEAEKIDYTAVIRERVGALELAAELLRSGAITPNEFPSDEVNLADIAWLSLDELMSDGGEIYATARTIAAEKSSRRTDRMSMQDVIDAAFDGLESGTFLTVSQIANRCGIAGVHTGPIAARLFPIDRKTKTVRECTLENVTAATGSNGVKGATLN